VPYGCAMTITCPECDSRFKVSEELIGKKAKCGACQHVFVVPEQEGAEVKPSDATAQGPTDPRERAWTSLYLAGMAALLLLFRGGLGGLGGMVTTLIFALAVETAAVYFAFRGWRDARQSLQAKASHLARTGLVVNGVLLALVALSGVLTVYQLVAGPAAGPGLGGLQDLMKNYNDLLKQLPQ
jgi:predicted Zn finger-like uncharacterized protein